MLQVSIPNIFAFLDVCCTCFISVLHMFHTYVVSVSSVCCICFTHMMQVFHRYCMCFAMATHMFFSCLRRMLQVFQLFRTYVANVSLRYCKVDLVLHILQPSVAAAGPACMRMGVEGAQAAGVGNCVGID
jgi:hypothetical protein